jgi:hypothetical protein
MDNTETQATLDTRHRATRSKSKNTTQKTKKQNEQHGSSRKQVVNLGVHEQ